MALYIGNLLMAKARSVYSFSVTHQAHVGLYIPNFLLVIRIIYMRDDLDRLKGEIYRHRICDTLGKCFLFLKPVIPAAITGEASGYDVDRLTSPYVVNRHKLGS